MPKMREPLMDEELRNLVKNGQKKYVDYKEAMRLYPIGRHTIEELVEDANAKRYVKGRVLINIAKVDEFIENNCACE